MRKNCNDEVQAMAKLLESQDQIHNMASLKNFLFRWRMKIKIKTMISTKMRSEDHDYKTFMEIATKI